MIDLTEVIVALIGLVSVVVSTVLVPYLKQKKTAEELAQISETLVQIQFWVDIGVQAAEMIFIGSGRGEEKKAYVIEFLNSKGFTIDPESIDAMIEASVLKLQQQ